MARIISSMPPTTNQTGMTGVEWDGGMVGGQDETLQKLG